MALRMQRELTFGQALQILLHESRMKWKTSDDVIAKRVSDAAWRLYPHAVSKLRNLAEPPTDWLARAQAALVIIAAGGKVEEFGLSSDDLPAALDPAKLSKGLLKPRMTTPEEKTAAKAYFRPAITQSVTRRYADISAFQSAA